MKKLTLSLALLAALAGCNNKADTPTPAAPKAVTGRADVTYDEYLGSGQVMLPGDQLTIPSHYRFVYSAYLTLQTDGNVVLYGTYRNSTREALWATGTEGRGGDKLVMQGDGNLVLYNTNTGQAVWDSGTQYSPGAYLQLSPRYGEPVSNSDVSLFLTDANDKFIKLLNR